jgi:hypothetical protein
LTCNRVWAPLAAEITAFTTAATELDYGARTVRCATERIIVRLLIQTGRPLAQLRAADLDELAAALHRRTRDEFDFSSSLSTCGGLQNCPVRRDGRPARGLASAHLLRAKLDTPIVRYDDLADKTNPRADMCRRPVASSVATRRRGESSACSILSGHPKSADV